MTEVRDYLGAERAVTSLTRDEFFGLANDNSHLLQPATVLQQALRQKVVGLKFWREQVSGHRLVTAEMTAERRETTTKRGLRSRDSNHREPTKRRQQEIVRERERWRQREDNERARDGNLRVPRLTNRETNRETTERRHDAQVATTNHASSPLLSPPLISSHLVRAVTFVTSSPRLVAPACVAASLRQIDHRNKHDDGSKLGKLRDMSGKVKA